MFDTGASRRYCAGVENGGDILPHPADTTRKTAMTAGRPSLGGVPGTARFFASSFGKATTAQGRGGQSDEIGQGGPLYFLSLVPQVFRSIERTRPPIRVGQFWVERGRQRTQRRNEGRTS